MASRTLASASRRVSPIEVHPGRSGTYTEYRPSSSRSTTTEYSCVVRIVESLLPDPTKDARTPPAALPIVSYSAPHVGVQGSHQPSVVLGATAARVVVGKLGFGALLLACYVVLYGYAMGGNATLQASLVAEAFGASARRWRGRRAPWHAGPMQGPLVRWAVSALAHEPRRARGRDPRRLAGRGRHAAPVAVHVRRVVRL